MVKNGTVGTYLTVMSIPFFLPLFHFLFFLGVAEYRFLLQEFLEMSLINSTRKSEKVSKFVVVFIKVIYN